MEIGTNRRSSQLARSAFDPYDNSKYSIMRLYGTKLRALGKILAFSRGTRSMISASAAGKSMISASAGWRTASASIMILYPCFRRNLSQDPSAWSRIISHYARNTNCCLLNPIAQSSTRQSIHIFPLFISPMLILTAGYLQNTDLLV